MHCSFCFFSIFVGRNGVNPTKIMKFNLTRLFATGCSLSILFSGCFNKQAEKIQNENECDSTIILPADEAVYGHLGEGTGMSVLEFITNDGDTLELTKTNEETDEDGIILGEIANYTDQYAVITANDNQSIDIVLNVSQLARSWQSAVNKGKGITLMTDGKTKALPGNDSCQYDRWGLYNCKLVLENTGETDLKFRCDTFDILSLTLDSLTVRNVANKTTETFYPLNPDSHGSR